MDQELRRMFEMKETEMTVPATLSPKLRNRIGRQRMVMGGLVAAAALALVIGGFAGARSLSSDQAIPPANPRPEEIFADVGGWITYSDAHGIWALDLTSPGDPADRVRLSSTPGTPIEWSPDGSKLLVLRDVPPTDPGAPFSTDLFVVNSDGTETRLTDANGSINGSSFSPDGAAVVYAVGGEYGGCCSSAIYVVDAEGGSPQVLLTSGSRRYPDEPGRFETSLGEPKWSPDGSQIAYFDGMGDWGHSLRIMDRDGTDSRVVVENRKTLGVGHVHGLQWSPDGSRLAFSVGDGLYLVGVDGSGFRLVTGGSDPYWSPDGSHLAYTSEGGSLAIVRLDDLQVQDFGEGKSGPWTSELRW